MFCSECGKEVSDRAAVCINCGVALNNGAAAKAEKSERAEKSAAQREWVFPLVSVVSFAGAVLLFLLSLNVYDYGFYLDAPGAIFMFLTAANSLVFGIMSFVFCQKGKQANKFLPYLSFILSISICVFTLIALIKFA